MKNKIKFLVLSAVIFAGLSCSTAKACTYTRVGVITAVDSVVEIETTDHSLWEYEMTATNLRAGNIVILKMSNEGTETIYDDTMLGIVKIK